MPHLGFSALTSCLLQLATDLRLGWKLATCLPTMKIINAEQLDCSRWAQHEPQTWKLAVGNGMAVMLQQKPSTPETHKTHLYNNLHLLQLAILVNLTTFYPHPMKDNSSKQSQAQRSYGGIQIRPSVYHCEVSHFTNPWSKQYHFGRNPLPQLPFKFKERFFFWGRDCINSPTQVTAPHSGLVWGRLVGISSTMHFRSWIHFNI